MKVWRYGLKNIEGEPFVPCPGDAVAGSCEMEPGASIISVSFSSHGVTLYALVEGTGVTEERHFVVCGNDAELPDAVGEMNYRGTAKIIGGPTAHVFDAVLVEA